MTRRWPYIWASLVLVLTTLSAPARALEEPDRLWLVGERSFADGLYPLSRRVLERFVVEYPGDPRASAAFLLLGQARLALGDAESALEAFRRLRVLPPPSGHPLEGRFWEAETLFQLKRYAEARTVYDEVVRGDAAGPKAPDALYGLAWCDLELKSLEGAARAFRELVDAWPEHRLAPSATFHLARALVELQRPGEALPLLEGFVTKYPDHRFQPEARYLLGLVRIESGDSRGGLADLRAFVAASPTHAQVPEARRRIVAMLARSSDPTELREAYRALMEQTPPAAEALYEAAAIAGRLGQPAEQAAARRRLAGEFPEHPLARRVALEEATEAFTRRDWKEAAARARVAARSEQTSVRAEALLLAGEADLKLRRFADAARAFEGVAALDGVEASLRYRALAGLGLAHEERKDWPAALAAYESVVSESPDATLRDWARGRVSAVKQRLQRPPPRPRSRDKAGRRS